MQLQIQKNSNSNLKKTGANVDTGSLGVLMHAAKVGLTAASPDLRRKSANLIVEMPHLI
jgi:hypothetical protein